MAHGRAAVQPQLRARAAAAPLAAAALAVFADGGYGAVSRVAFGVAALVALAVVAFAGGGFGARAGGVRLREPVALVLLALAALGTLSALWTLGPVDRTVRWALVTAGYAALALAAGAVARRRNGVEALAGGVAVLAVAAAGAGLVAAVAFEPPWAERIAGVWRPGGPFEYPPALALLMVSGLPALLAGMVQRSRPVAGASAVGMALAGGVLALSASRLSVAMAVAVAGAAIAWPRATARAPRALVVGALAQGAVAAVAFGLAASGSVEPGAGVEPLRVVVLAVVGVGAAPLWLALRRRLLARPAGPGTRRLHPLAATAAVLAVAALAGSVAFGTAAGRGSGPASDFLHGRAGTWRAAVATFADRPLAGAGADAFLAGSARHQGGGAIAFAHDLPLELGAELGVAGLLLALALYAASARALWRARRTRAAWLLGPAAAAFLLAGLVDWPWHLAGAGAVWALAVGALAAHDPAGPPPPGANSRAVKTHSEETT